MSISQRTISIPVAGHAVPLYVAVPEAGNGPGLLLLHDAHGASDHMKHQANLYAEEGWVVALPDLYAPAHSGRQFTYDAADLAAAAAASAALDGDAARAVGYAAVTALGALPEIAGGIAVIGHGAGAAIALRLAADTPALACAVGYGLPAYDGPWPACPTVVHVGDAAVTAAHVEQLRAALAQ